MISQQQKGQQKALHLSREVCQSERQTAVPRGPKAVGPRILPPLRPLFFFPPSSVSPFLSPPQHHFSHSLTVLYSHSIKFKQRHAGLFIGEWCFFISLCLFVALRCTEGFLAADVSSAALQRIGGYVRQKDRKKDTK